MCCPQVPALRSWKPFVVESNFVPWVPPDDWAAAVENEVMLSDGGDEQAESGFTPYPPYSSSDSSSPIAGPKAGKEDATNDIASDLKAASAEPTATLSVPLDEWVRTVRQAAAATGATDAGDSRLLRDQLLQLQPSQLIQKCRALGASEAACDACADADVPREAYARLFIELLNE